MRARNIKPGFFKNEELAECSFQARLLFAGLWCMADREGRLEKRPLRIKAELFPYDNIDINGELTVIERKGFVKTYVVDGKEYLQVLHFEDHQHPHHTEAASKLPEMTEENSLTVNSRLNNGEYPADSLIHRFSDSLIPDSPHRNDKAVSIEVVASDKPKRPAPQKKIVSDDEWLESIKSNPAYQGIDVDREHGKMMAWCQTHNKMPSRKRFLNWLNRADRPMSSTTSSRYDFLLETAKGGEDGSIVSEAGA
jgi:hypothetical protein